MSSNHDLQGLRGTCNGRGTSIIRQDLYGKRLVFWFRVQEQQNDAQAGNVSKLLAVKLCHRP
jgi:hypothetical protein